MKMIKINATQRNNYFNSFYVPAAVIYSRVIYKKALTQGSTLKSHMSFISTVHIYSKDTSFTSYI